MQVNLCKKYIIYDKITMSQVDSGHNMDHFLKKY